MSRERTAEEVKQHHFESMGDELGGLYHALWNELAWLHSKWKEYVDLFGTKPSRIELINKAAGHFFRIAQDSLWEGTILHIARLTDPPKSAGKENLTIRKLPNLIKDEKTKDNVSRLVEVAVENASFCRDWRNRHIAHKDFNLAVETGADPLMAASRAKIKLVLDSLSDVLDGVSLFNLDSSTCFDVITAGDGAVSLLYVLDDGLRADEERMKRIRESKHFPEDFQNRDL
ncbi:MAG: hypothetical protein VB050_12160 [Geobacteraceae bacterium]|nr:hypothetical protein [Geobacteraceae bacterium]